MRILVTGHRGQLGSELLRQLANAQHDVTGIDQPEHDITAESDIGSIFAQAQPELVIHTAALTNVDYCAKHPDEALRVNAGGTEIVALACKRAAIAMAYVSTNEVFDGQAGQPYQENAIPNPINPYAISKYAGEQAVQKHLAHYFIMRTAWLYGPQGTNFVHKIIARAREELPLRVVDDEIGSPTYVSDLAAAIVRLIGTEAFGIYHLVNNGACSRYEFAREILTLAKLGQTPIEPISSSEFERASTPPPFTPLANVRGAQIGIELRRWQAALAEFVQNLVLNESAS